MKISIITPTLNHARFIEDTILSVKNQDYKDFEHIVIDGGSDDGTIDILRKYPHLIWISEKDSGQSNAINKGFKMAKGDIITWLNSDDYFENNIFSRIVKLFEDNKDCFVLYGNMTDIGENKNILGTRTGDTITLKHLLINPDIVRQPGCFWRREVINRIGNLNEDLHLVMDYDYFLRIAKQFKFYHVNINLCYFRLFQGTKTSRLPKRQLQEIYWVMRKESSWIPFRFYLFLFNRKYFSMKQKLFNVIKRLIRISWHLQILL
ncbi:MAG: glycosyltransferase family 2 protein [Chitinivibrionales bacterium]